MLADAHLLFAPFESETRARIGLIEGEALEIHLPEVGAERRWRVVSLPAGTSVASPSEEAGVPSCGVLRLEAGPDARQGELVLRAVRNWEPSRDGDPVIRVLVGPQV